MTPLSVEVRHKSQHMDDLLAYIVGRKTRVPVEINGRRWPAGTLVIVGSIETGRDGEWRLIRVYFRAVE